METPEIEPVYAQPIKPKKLGLGWLWPAVTNDEEAVKASRSGAFAASIVAILTTVIATVALVTKEPVMGITGWSLMDAALFAIIAWRTFKFSFGWALVGLVVYCGEMFWKWGKNGETGNVVVPVLLILAFTSGVRGTAFLSGKAR